MHEPMLQNYFDVSNNTVLVSHCFGKTLEINKLCFMKLKNI